MKGLFRLISLALLLTLILSPVTTGVALAAGHTWTQTTQADFEAGTLSQVDTTSSPGDVKLATSGRYIYAFQGNDTTSFWRYDITTNSWTSMANATANVKEGGALAYVGVLKVSDLTGELSIVPLPPAPAPPPAPAAEPVSYGWLIVIAVISAIAVLAALAFIMATKRKRLQHALGMERGWFEKPAEAVPSPFRVGNLKITPNRVKPGEIITAFAEATNTGPVTSSCSLVLKIKGIAEVVKEITLSPGQSQKVAFTIIKTKPGVYDVDLEDLKGSFTVEEVAAPPDSSSQ